MKLRVSIDLRDRAKDCADAIDETLTNFIGLAIINDMKGRFDDIAFDEKLISATKEDFTVITFFGDAKGGSCARVKLALVRAVLFVEASQPSPLGNDVREEIRQVNESSLKLARRMKALRVS